MKLLVAVALFVLLAGCVAQPYHPIIDPGTRTGDYNTDLEQCKDVAARVQPGNTTAGGAVVGGVFAGLLAAAVGLRGNDVARVAAWGAANGAVHGYVVGTAEWQHVVDECMARRGYNVIE